MRDRPRRAPPAMRRARPMATAGPRRAPRPSGRAAASDELRMGFLGCALARPGRARPIPRRAWRAQGSGPAAPPCPSGIRATRAKQGGDRGRGGGDARGDGEPVRRKCRPPLGRRAKQAIAAVGEVDPTALGEQRPGQRSRIARKRSSDLLPMARQARARRPPHRRGALGSTSSISRASSVRARSAASRSASAAALVGPRTSFASIASRSSGSIAGGTGSPHPPDRALRRSARRARDRRSGSAAAAAGPTRWRERRPRSPSGRRGCWEAGCAPRQGQRIAAEPRDQARDERVGERAVGRDGEDRRASRSAAVRHSAASASVARIDFRRCRRRTTGPGGRRRSSGPRRSPGPRRSWSRTARRAHPSSSALRDDLDPGEDERRDLRLLAAAEACRRGPCGNRPGRDDSGPAPAGPAATAHPSARSSQCDASSFSVSAGPSIQKLSLLTARNGSPSINGAALTSPAARFEQQVALVGDGDVRARCDFARDAPRARPAR